MTENTLKEYNWLLHTMKELSESKQAFDNNPHVKALKGKIRAYYKMEQERVNEPIKIINVTIDGYTKIIRLQAPTEQELKDIIEMNNMNQRYHLDCTGELFTLSYGVYKLYNNDVVLAFNNRYNI